MSIVVINSNFSLGTSGYEVLTRIVSRLRVFLICVKYSKMTLIINDSIAEVFKFEI